jgi:hypothetical protein
MSVETLPLPGWVTEAEDANGTNKVKAKNEDSRCTAQYKYRVISQYAYAQAEST